ncbi:peptide chain release factor 2 [Rubrobacter taiwanensis]|uniref:Peptide chain release factor 2 n=1 Tax=Rubrobacter taiwanensis TaxID=185139 RepID=A0A4R1BPH0_9ACTN|nr:peptide chain release factor 2 [Rubrobacter taiwanensis]TCJ19441.1 peptide chain release factor 2 [Rubrobacter taiwanensis]
MEEHLKNLRARLEELGNILDVEGLRKRTRELAERMSRPDFWDDPEEARSVSAEFSRIEGRLKTYDGLRDRLTDAEELYELAEGDEALLREVEEEVRRIERELEVQELERLFVGEYDESAAILAINPGAGGVDSQDWAEMLARMYRRWAERNGYRLEVVEYTPAEEGGIKSATFTISGDHAFGLLSAERGVHRLVRISPYDASGRRHTSFASVAVAPVVDDEVTVEIDEKDLKVDTYRASGAGGQHVNKTDSAVRITHLPTGMVVQCQNERSQHQNREVAMRILRARLFELERQKRQEEIAAQSGEKAEIGWGSQIRSYVLHPYRMVKDLRTGVETSDVDRVLDGDLDEFIYSYLRSRAVA